MRKVTMFGLIGLAALGMMLITPAESDAHGKRGRAAVSVNFGGGYFGYSRGYDRHHHHYTPQRAVYVDRYYAPAYRSPYLAPRCYDTYDYAPSFRSGYYTPSYYRSLSIDLYYYGR